jgi:hypothetical protein
MSEHLELETLSDLADEILPAAEWRRAEQHLARCAPCAERLARLRALLAASRALPVVVEPPDDLWTDVHARLAPRRRHAWLSGWTLAAAALVLVAVSSAVTALLMRHSARPAPVVAQSQPFPVVLPAQLRAVEASYDITARELAATLAQRRAALSPATIAKIETSLRVIDRAIAEARQALAEDPANRTLVDLFSSNYERKLELLRRAAELNSAT